MNCSVCGHRTAMLAFLSGLLCCVFTVTASASTVVVGTCKNLVKFSTIQSAIDSVPSGSTIDICPGSYPEQLSISKNLTLNGVANGSEDGIYIVSPNGGLATYSTNFASGDPLAPHVAITGPGLTVNISNLTVDSLNNGVSACDPQVVGILYQNSFGTVNHVVTRNQWIGASESDPSLNGCQNGYGIFVQANDSNTAVLTVTNSSVHDYQKNGIVARGAGTTLTASSNYVVGQGATNGAAENGIEVAFGAAASVSNNVVIDNVWAPDTISDPGDGAAGILLYDAASGATVKSNTVGNNQFGIGIETDTAGEGNSATVESNKVFGTRIFDGIDVCSDDNTIESNTIVNSSESGIHLDGSCGAGNSNTVGSNTIIDSCVGILEDSGTTNPGVGTDTFYTVTDTTGSACSMSSGPMVRMASKGSSLPKLSIGSRRFQP